MDRAIQVRCLTHGPISNSRVADNRADLVNRTMWVNSPISGSIIFSNELGVIVAHLSYTQKAKEHNLQFIPPLIYSVMVTPRTVNPLFLVRVQVDQPPFYRYVSQLAEDSGRDPECCRFESCHSDQFQNRGSMICS